MQRDELWNVLVDTVHSLPMYKGHKHYVQEVMLKDKADISAQELSVQINLPLGEAMVLLDEIRGPNRTQPDSPSNKTAGQTLLDFEK
jgi:hypothetical protein